MFNFLKNKIASFIGKTKVEVEKSIEAGKKDEEKPKIKPEKPVKGITVETKVKTVFKQRVMLSEKDVDNLLSELNLDLIQSDVAV